MSKPKKAAPKAAPPKAVAARPARVAKPAPVEAQAPAIDVAGTAPGLQAPTKPGPRVVAMRCRYEGCTGAQCLEILGGPTEMGAPSNRVYQCTTCQGSWGLPVGGVFPY